MDILMTNDHVCFCCLLIYFELLLLRCKRDHTGINALAP
jgi:hypothetical protein